MSDAYRAPKADSEAPSDPQVERGRVLVLVVISLLLSDAVLQAVVAGRVFRALAIAGLSLALYRGRIWARLVLVLGFMISSGYTLWEFPFRETGWTFWSLYAALGIVSHLASVAVLMSSSAVERFLSDRRG